jgi:PAS domain S-box-containing protein
MNKSRTKKTAEESSSVQTGAVPGSMDQNNGGSPAVEAGVETEMHILDILNALPFYVIIVDENHRILEANEAVYSHLGKKRGDIIGQYCPLIIHGIDHPYEGCPLEESAETNRAVERELYDKKSGHTVSFAIYPMKILSREGKKTFLHMVNDITEHKQTEEQLRASLEQLRVLSAHLETVKEDEKRKIAADLHDETSQLLASLNALLEAGIGRLPSGSEKAETILRKAQTLSITILDDLHKLIYNLRPSLLDRFGLKAAIGALVDSHLKVGVPRVTFKSMGEVRRLPPGLEIAIVKHANAASASVKLDFQKDNIKIVIEDDGKGFDLTKTTNPRNKMEGLGLLSMKERLEPIQGTLTIKSTPGQGTKLAIKVPLTSEVRSG